MRFLRFTCLLLSSLAIAAPVSAQGAGWNVIEPVVEIDSTKELLLLSPDGRMIFETNLGEPDEMCVREIVTFKIRCDDVSVGMIPQNSVTWAPDSSAVVFTTDWTASGMDSDIQVFDAETGTVENLTDDGVQELAEIEGGCPIDVYASWTPDSQDLIFQRLTWGTNEHQIMKIARDGGTQEEFVSLPGDVAPMLNAPIHIAEDGSLLFSTSPAPDETLHNGVFRITPNGAVDLLVAGPAAPGLPTILGDVSPDGTMMIVSSLHLTRSDPAAPYVFLMDSKQGTTSPIEGDLCAGPVFLPDGSGALTASRSDDHSITLSVLSLEGSTTDLYTIPPEENPEPGLAALPFAPTLAWVDSGVILAHMATGTWLLTVEPDASLATPMSDLATSAPESTPGTPQPARSSPAAATPPPHSQAEAPYRALSPSDVQPGGEIARLSPDGDRVAIMRSSGATELCIRKFDPFDETCADIGITSVNLQTLTWSPDSTALVFTDEPILTGRDSDIWLLDAVTGDVTNLTDDGTDVLAEPGSSMDVQPGWSPDGSEIIFQRYHADGVSLMRMSRDEGEPGEIVRFPAEYATVMSAPAFFLEDGSIILGTMPATGFTTGIFRIEPDGAFEQLGSDSLIPSQDSVVVLDVTADGSTAIIYGRAGYELRFHRGGLGLLDLDTGELTQPESLAGVPASPATFSPDDTKMLSVVTGEDDGLSMMLTELASGAVFELTVLDPPDDDSEAMYPHISLVWAANDVVLLHTGMPTSVLVSLVPATP